MKNALQLFLIFCSFPFYSFSQDSHDVKELYADAEYFFLYEDYEEALFSYNLIYKRGNEDNACLNYRIGQCYLNIPGEKQKAIYFLRKAVQNMSQHYTEGNPRETKAPYDAQFYLGCAYRINNNLDSAVIAFKNFRKSVDPKEKLTLKIVDREIESCKFAAELMKNPVNINKILLDKPINTPQRDFSPAVSADEQMIVYNSSQKFYQAIFFSRKKDGKWTAPVNITPQVQSDGNQYASSLSFDGNTLLLREEDEFQANLRVSEYKNGTWMRSVPLNKNINTKYWEGNASLSKDGKVLYFSSNRKGGEGGLDLYKSVIQANGQWGTAVNLGKIINTEMNEDDPFITEDGTRLYFISQGHQTMGGFDIYYTEIKPDESFGQPVNLGYPVNTTDDDVSFTPVNNGRSAYMSLYSPQGLGKQDLYRIEIAGAGLKLPPLTDQIIEKPEEKKELAAEEAQIRSGDLSEKEKEQISSEVTKRDFRSPDMAVSKIVFFMFNSSLLTDKAKKQLDHLVLLKKNIPDLRIELTGNTDSKGPDAYNQKLSNLRALSCKRYLVNKGIDPAHIITKGLGEKNSIAINNNPDGTDNPTGRMYNRRVEINLSGMGLSYLEEVIIPENLRIHSK